MKYLIIEDEPIAAQRLAEKIAELRPTWDLTKTLGTIKALESELKNSDADLAFVDIHLGDGSSFQVLEKHQLSFPLIFTTAYDEYAIRAFKLNSVDYLLKPIHIDDLRLAIEKLERQQDNNKIADWQKMLKDLNPQYKERFLVAQGQKLKTISSDEAAYFYAKGKHCFLIDFKGQEFLVDYKLKELIEALNPEQFYQINRQFIVNLKAISELIPLSKSRYKVITKPDLHEEGIVSSERSSSFKNWLQG